MKTLKFTVAAAAFGCFLLPAQAKTAAADAEGVVKLDFSDQMNMDLEDEIAGDEKGGWNDHGENDARNFPLGRAKYCNVPFRVIDPAANNRKALLVPKNHRLEKGPDSATAEVVHAAPAKFLYLMHATAWEAKQRSPFVGSIVLTDDKGKSEEIKVRLFEDAWGWWDWFAKDHTNAYICARIPALEGTGYMYVSEFKVPASLGPISKVTFKSAGRETSGAYWMIMAATLANDATSRREIEKPKPPYVINQQTPGWKPIVFPKENGVLPGSVLDLTGSDLVPVGKYGRLVPSADGRLVYEKRPDLEFRSSCTWGGGYWSDFLDDPSWNARVKRGEKVFADFAGVPYTNDVHVMIAEFAKALRRSGYRILRIAGLPGLAWRGLDFEEKEIDNFFWLIKCFRENGIYIHLDTPGSFTWNQAWWMWGDNHLGRQWLETSMAYWRRDIRENWREGMTRYMNLVNPYTGCALKDEPVIAFLELANEANMRSKPFTGEPEAHAALAAFLKEKYGDLAGVKKAWGEYFDDSWKSLETIPVDFLWQEGRGRKGARHQDMQELYVRRMQWLHDWHRKVLVEEIGCKQMITEYNMVQALGHSAARHNADYIAHNAYFNHPAGKTLSPNSVIAAKNSWMRGFVSCQYAARPYVITEADIVFFSPKRYEQPFTLNGYAALNGIDVVNGFCLTFPSCGRGAMGDWSIADKTRIWHFFGWYDPLKLASEFLGAHFTTRGKVRESDITCRIVLDEKEILEAGDMVAGLGSDQTQLSLVTRFGIVWKDQLGKERPPEGAKVLDFPRSGATEIVREKLFSNMIDATDANGFDAQKAVDEMKARGWIPKANRTDVKKGVFESSTGELYLDTYRKYGTVNAPAAQGLFAEKGATAKLADFEVVSMDEDAMLCAVSHGDEPLKESRRIAVVFATNALNDGMEFTDETMSEWIKEGKAPVIVRCAKATFRVRTKYAKGLKCWAVDLNGRRTDPIPVSCEDDWVTVSLDTAALPHGPAIFFELAEE